MTVRTARRADPHGPDDAGMTLIELLVAMGIFVTVIAVFMSGVVLMTKDAARAAGVSDATTTARRVLDRFDKQVRYSVGVNRPGFGTSGAYYVEFMVPSQTAGATPVCIQWQFNPTADTISVRTWTDSLLTPTPSVWNPVATNVRNNVTTELPFVFIAADLSRNAGHQELTVMLDIGVASRPGAKVSATYAARNTVPGSQTNLDINPADGQSDTPVCQAGVGRP